MCKGVLAVTALLVFCFSGTVAADDKVGQYDKRTQKVIAALKMFGISHPDLNRVVATASSKVEKDGYFYLADQNMNTGRVALRFQVQGMPQMRQLQLSYVPKDSHYAVTATTRGVMFNYKYEFK